jgi:hypothetical protein
LRNKEVLVLHEKLEKIKEYSFITIGMTMFPNDLRFLISQAEKVEKPKKKMNGFMKLNIISEVIEKVRDRCNQSLSTLYEQKT